MNKGINKPTWGVSSEKESRKKDSSSSSAFSIRSAYSPMIQIMLALASGSSKVSKFSHRAAMTCSYLGGREGDREGGREGGKGEW